MVEFRVLGALDVVRDGEHLAVPSRRQRALITRLLLGRGQVVPVDALVDALWDTRPPEHAQHALHTYVSRVRAVLGAAAVVTRAPGYLLAAEPEAVDAERFEAGVGRAADLLDRDAPETAGLLGELLALWRGSAYAEFAHTFARAAAVRLDELRLTARELRAEALIRIAELDPAIGELGELVADEPLRERPHAQLMRALSLSGRQTDALDLYRGYRSRLMDELGLEPSAELDKVHEDVLRQAVVVPASHPARDRAAVLPGDRPAPRHPVLPAAAPKPPPATSFVGRDRELAALEELVTPRRVVTLAGPGGVGKTRLARELAARGTTASVWWVDLAPAATPDDVPYRFVDALGVPEPAEGAIEDFVVDMLSAGDGLLVADNCEHVIERAASVLERITELCPRVAVLATSRERLAVAGEHVLTVAPLPEPAEVAGSNLRASPAVALFTDRLRAAGAADLSDDDVTLVAEVCRRIGRLPLAIELAAARARSLGVGAVAERPTLDLLAGATRTGQTRHRSLRAVVDWSHDLLSSRERILFRRLAVFAGAFSLDALEEVCAGGMFDREYIAETLAALVDKSMVAGPDEGRWRLLGPMRAYAAEQLSSHGEDEWLQAAHARHFVQQAERAAEGMATSAEKQWTARLARDVDELRVAHRWACAHDADLALRLAAALAPYAQFYMRFELQEWAAAAAELPDATGHPLRAVALASAATGAWMRGEFDRARALAQAGLAAAPEGRPVRGKALLVLADVDLLEGRFGTAAAMYEDVVKLAADADPHLTCEAMGGLALTHSYLGDLEGAARFAEEGLRVARRLGAPGLVATALYYAGESCLASDPDAALELLEEARRQAVEGGVLFIEGVATLSLVSIRARAASDPVEALAAYREAIEHWRRVGNRTQQWVTLRNLVPILVQAGHDELACALHGAVAGSPVHLPADVVVPEAGALAEAHSRARQRLGDAAPAAGGPPAAPVPPAQAASSR